MSPTETHFTAWGIVGPTPEGVSEEKWQYQNEGDWKHFCAVSDEVAKVIDGWGAVAHSLGYSQNIFNTAEGRLTAFHAEIKARTGTV